MKKAAWFSLIGGILFISACSFQQEKQDTTQHPLLGKEDRFESSNSSITQSKKDGVFLTTCSVTPNSLVIRDSFSLDIKEAFIEQRFSLGAMTNKVKLMDSLELYPKLIIVFRQNALLSHLWRDSFIELRGAPYTGGESDDIVVFNLTKEHLGKKFALRLRIRNKLGQFEDYNLVVIPRPVKQALAASYNASMAQAKQAGTLLATCTAAPLVVATDSFRLHIQESFIEHRFLVGERTHGVQLLDSGRVRSQLVLVTTPDSKLNSAGTTWAMILPDGGKLTGYQERTKTLTFDLPERDLNKDFVLQLRLKNQRGNHGTHLFHMQPTIVRQLPHLAVVPKTTVLPESLDNGVFEERSPVYNTSTSNSHKAGMLLNEYNVIPTTVAVGKKFRLDIDQIFTEKHALITSVSKRIELDSANLVGPRLVIACEPTSTFGELGIDWDMQLQAGGRNLVYQVEQQKDLLLFYLPPVYMHSSLIIQLKVRNQQGAWEEHSLQVTPKSHNSI